MVLERVLGESAWGQNVRQLLLSLLLLLFDAFLVVRFLIGRRRTPGI